MIERSGGKDLALPFVLVGGQGGCAGVPENGRRRLIRVVGLLQTSLEVLYRIDAAKTRKAE